MKKNRIKADPYGTDEEFDRYIRASNRKLYALILAIVILSTLFVIM